MVCTSVNLGGLLGSVPLTDGFQRLSRPTNAGHVVHWQIVRESSNRRETAVVMVAVAFA